jgi:hypothetical protein
VKITIILLVSVFLRISAASAAGSGADCTTSYQNSDVLGELVAVETAFRNGADSQAAEASKRLLSGLGCLDEEVDEDFSFRVDDFVAGHAVFGAYKKLGREMLPDTTMVDGKLSAGKHYLDGRPLYSKMATDDRPHLYQHKYNGVQTTVIEGNTFPEMVTEDNRVVLSNVGSSPEKDKRAVKKAAKKAAKAAAKLAKAEAKAAEKLAKTEAVEAARLEAEVQRVAKLEATQAAKAQAEKERLAVVEAKALRDSEEKNEYAAEEAEQSRLAARQASLDAEATATAREQERERIAKAEVARVEAADAADRGASENAMAQKLLEQKEAKALAAQQAKAASSAQAQAEADAKAQAQAKADTKAKAQAKAQAKADAKRAKMDAKRLAKVKPKKATSTMQHSNRLGAVVLQRERPVLKTPMLIAGVLVGVGVSGTLYYGAFDARSVFNQATTEQQVFDSRSKTNQLLVASGAALAVGSGMYTVGVILSDSGFSLRGNF